MEHIIKHEKSFLVPSVQELTKSKIEAIPSRYIRPDDEDLVISVADVLPEIPVIDLQSLLSEASELAKLDLACKEWGFFQLVNHGISSLLLEEVKKGIEDFFNLPMEEKKYGQISQEVEGFGQAFVLNEDQKLDWDDLFFMVTLPACKRKPHLFPQLPLPFTDTIESYSEQLMNLALTIMKQMAKALNMKEREIGDLFEEGRQSTRMNYYPACPEPKKVIGPAAHSDGAALTLLLQVNEVEGLRIRKDAMWIPVKPPPNAFIVNVGDVLEIMTNGIYRSIEHGATIKSKRERISIATFYNARHDGELGPATSLITEQRPAQFKTIETNEFIRGVFAHKLTGKSYLDSLRLEHSNSE